MERTLWIIMRIRKLLDFRCGDERQKRGVGRFCIKSFVLKQREKERERQRERERGNVI
jgi:hypothetical protein